MIKKSLLIILSFFLIQLFSNYTISVEPDEILKDQNHELRARNISKNIRCMVCQNQSIDESNALLEKIYSTNFFWFKPNSKQIYPFSFKKKSAKFDIALYDSRPSFPPSIEIVGSKFFTLLSKSFI